LSRKQKNKEEKLKKGHKALKSILIVLIIIFVMLAGFVSYSTYKNGWGWSGILATMMGHDSSTLEEMEPLQILLLGVSSDISSKLTDTIMVASYDPKTQSASLLSVPRDTFVGKSKDSATSYDKINALYQKGPEATLEAVNEITGMDIKYYAVIDNEALIKVVDVIGGVDFDVPIDMNYDDPTQDLHIHLEAGMQHIDGEKAEQLLRFRHNNNGTSYSSEYGDNDLGRMRTQREFMTTVAKQTLQLQNVLKINSLLDVVYDYLETNIKLSDVKDYIPYALDFNVDDLETAAVPGTTATYNKLSFFEYNKTETAKIVQELFYDNDEESTTESDGSTSSTSTSVTTTEAAGVKIELLNGSGTSSKLSSATKALKKKGYNVYKTGTTTTTSTTTIINNTNKDKEITTNIKELLKVGTVSSSATSSDSKADITIILGKDYKE
jgi:LCP family protein required for cell wall assembly